MATQRASNQDIDTLSQPLLIILICFQHFLSASKGAHDISDYLGYISIVDLSKFICPF